MTILTSTFEFVANNWQSFIASIVASLIATGIVAILLIKIFRVPNFDLHLDYIQEKKTEQGISLPVLDISVVNKKIWIGFSNEGIYFGLFIPKEFVSSKELFLITSRGMERWFVDPRGKEIFNINKTEYLLYRGVVNLPVHSDSRTHFLRITGSFNNDKTVRICYYFETPYGRFPTFLRFGKRIISAESGKLPYAEIGFD